MVLENITLSYTCFNAEDCRLPAISTEELTTYMLSGFWLAFCGVAYLLQWTADKYWTIGEKLHLSDEDSDVDTDADAAADSADADADADGEDNADEVAAAVKAFTNLYFDELEQLQNTPSSSLVQQHVLTEFSTPRGPVRMIYDEKEGLFKYFSDVAAKLSYNVLDTVARQYAVTLGVPNSCIHARNALKKVLAEQDVVLPAENTTVVAKKSVFAQFKKYKNSSTATSDANKEVLVPANVFRYAGKLADTVVGLQTAEKKEPLPIDYLTFKRQLMKL